MSKPFNDVRKGMIERVEGASGSLDEPKGVWIEKTKYISEASHKVRIHHVSGESEVRYVSDEELDVLRKEPHISKVVHVNRGE